MALSMSVQTTGSQLLRHPRPWRLVSKESTPKFRVDSLVIAKASPAPCGYAASWSSAAAAGTLCAAFDRRIRRRRWRAARVMNQSKEMQDPMDAVSARPLAEAPAKPSPAALTAVATPDFVQYVKMLSEVRLARERLNEAVNAGRNLAFVACARLQRSDLVGARAALDSVAALPGIQESLGPGLWENLEHRLKICEACNVGGFLEVYIQSLGFLSFLESGQLAPE
ncbi:unnamed protein product, partial [Polarella glacialis]